MKRQPATLFQATDSRRSGLVAGACTARDPPHRPGHQQPAARGLGAVGQDTAKDQLRDLGYTPTVDDRIARPPDHPGGTGRPYMEPLTVRVDPDGTRRIAISETESFAESQQRLESALGATEKQRLASVRQRAARAAEPGEVVVLRGTYDTKVTWADVLAQGTREQDLLQGLIRRRVPRDKAEALVAALKGKTGTIRVVLGTEPLRRYPYRTRYGKVAAGRPVHHFDPLYLGGQHKLLLDLPPTTHEWIHEFFDNLTLPSGPLAGTRLEPNTLQAAVPQWKPAAATLHPTGAVSYHDL